MYPARGIHVPLIVAVWVLSFPGNGQTLREAGAAIRYFVPHLLAAIRAGRAVVTRGGLGFAYWHVDPGGVWFLDFIATWPRRRRIGTRVLTQVLARVDETDAPVALVCRPSLVRWYRDHGFRVVHQRGHRRQNLARHGLVKLHRPAASRRICAAGPASLRRSGARAA